MPLEFAVNQAPFDRLTGPQRERLRASADVVYFRPVETIMEAGGSAEGLYVVIKGTVEERDGEELVALRGPGDWFDGQALVQGRGRNAFVAREETLCHVAPRELVLALIADNPRFGAFFYAEVSKKLGAIAADTETALARPMLQSRVGELRLAEAGALDAGESIEAAARRMEALGGNALLVTQGDRTGIVTGTDLWKASLLRGLPASTAVGEIAQFALVAVEADDFVSTALSRMTRHNKRRVAVRRDGALVGFLEDIDLLAFLGAGAQALGARIERASKVADLAPSAADIAGQTRLLRRQGVKIEAVCEIVSDLNRALFARVFALTAPPSIRRNGCLIVMGSEGRGEQTTRTDQDNGLILSGTVPEAELQAFRTDYSSALASFGFPPCPGGVMVSNPAWSKTLHEFERDVRGWIALGAEGGPLDAAILYDADAVAGDPAPLEAAKRTLVEAARGERAFMVRFAQAVDAFPTPIGLLNNLVTSRGAGDALDLKKGGVFPIVHGVRALALDHGLMETGTVDRIRRLTAENVFEPEFSADLVEAFRFLLSLRLDQQLAEIRADDWVKPGELTTMDRDLLRDAMQVARRLKDRVRRHFNLAMF
jgi:CBS domain-containing protein